MKLPTSASYWAQQRDLASRRKEERVIAEQMIREMGPDAFPFLLQIIEEQASIVKWRQRRYLIAILATIPCLFVTIIMVLTLQLRVIFGTTLPCLIVFLKYMFVARLRNRSTHLQNNACSLFAEIAGKEQLGPLIDLLEHTEGESSRAVCVALTRIFSQLQASDAERLTTAHRKMLLSLLFRLPADGRQMEGAFTKALLQALQQVGDSSFIHPVRRLTNIDASGIYGNGRIIAAAAKECLPYLEAFAQQEQKSGNLVRAAEAPEEESAILLRPAGAAGPPEEHARLVRPVAVEKAE